jgi:ubiquinone/menaquinone biosynthesis C-methylase UbiE
LLDEYSMSRLYLKARRPSRSSNSGQRAADSKLPRYAELLFALHEEFAPELMKVISQLPLKSGDRVLDVACGDGQYAVWMAERIGDGTITAVDASSAWLHVALKKIRGHGLANIALRKADARKLPFPDGSFDFVWCAQSLYSLPNVMQCMAEMVRVLKPGGALAVLEDDTLHHVLLPWAVDLELEVRRAELAAFQKEAVAPARFYVGRWTSRLLRRVGLRRVREHALAATRQAPLSPAAQRFFAEYLANLASRVTPHLSSGLRRRLERLVNPASRRYLLKQRDFVAVCLDRVVWGVRTQNSRDTELH